MQLFYFVHHFCDHAVASKGVVDLVHLAKILIRIAANVSSFKRTHRDTQSILRVTIALCLCYYSRAFLSSRSVLRRCSFNRPYNIAE